ncbi:MAG: DUF4886 domain-containing protein [Eubacteriales bacterium]|nr:DUF4886 domain-containing protein [Eubacteriales bacterium]
MKKILCIILTVFLLTGSFVNMAAAYSPAVVGNQSGSRATKILLIGNSYTYYNNFDDILKNVCEGAGKKVKITMVTKGGARLEEAADRHTKEGKEVYRLLKGQKWDYVVLQDRHYFPLVRPGKIKKAVMTLKPLIEGAGAKMALFMTWAPGNGHDDYIRYSSVVSGRRQYQAKIASAYEKIAREANAIVIPTGISFQNNVKQKTGIRLLRPDRSHPTYAGSYLSACTMFNTLLGTTSPTTYSGELNYSEAKTLRKIARQTVKQYKK